MNAARLTEYVRLEIETTAKNSVGTPIETYHLLKYTFASVVYRRGDTDFEQGAVTFTNTEFSIRWDNRVNMKCRIYYEDEYYKILHIEKIGRKDGLRLKCIKWDEV